MGLAVNNGKVHVSYYQQSPGPYVMYSRSGDLQPEGISDWTSYQLQVGSNPRIDIVDGVPCILFVDNQSDLYFAKAQSNTPSSAGDWNISKIFTGVGNNYLALTHLQDRPVAVFGGSTGDGDMLRCAIAKVSNPQPADWQFHIVADVSPASNSPYGDDGVSIVDGKLAVAWRNPDSGLFYSRATVEFPTSTSNWETMHLYESTSIVEHTSLVVINGLPLVAFSLSPTGTGKTTFHIASAAVPDPSSMHDWSITKIYTSSGNNGQSRVSIIENAGSPCVSLANRFQSPGYTFKYGKRN